MINNEIFLRGEITFLTQLIDRIRKEYPDTKKLIEEEIKKRTKIVNATEDKLDNVIDRFKKTMEQRDE